VVDLVTATDMRTPRGSSSLFVSGPEAEGTQFVAAGPDGACVFFEAQNGRLCTIHRRAGADALPSACRHFPRIYLRDARGLFLTLSHFCPTAAALLMDDGPLTIVEAAPPVALEGSVEAFEAEQALPPLLRPGLLMDLDAYGAWERASVDTFAREELTHEQALAVIAGATEAVRLWTAGGQPLSSHVEGSFAFIGLTDLALGDHVSDALRLDLIDVPRPADTTDSRERFVAPMWARFDRPIADTWRQSCSAIGSRMKAAACDRPSSGSVSAWRCSVTKPRGSRRMPPRCSTGNCSSRQSAQRTSCSSIASIRRRSLAAWRHSRNSELRT
jgi:hypothetical protein